MTDRLSPQQRRRCMQSNRSRGTKPEQLLAKELWRRGLRYRKNVRAIPGSPDFCFKALRIAVFVDGEFWHGRNWSQAKYRIQSRRDYWWPKIEHNMARDLRVNAQLADLGWTVIRFWDSEVRTDLPACADIVQEQLRQAQLARLHRQYAYDTRYPDAPDPLDSAALLAAEDAASYGPAAETPNPDPVQPTSPKDEEPDTDRGAIGEL